MLVVFVAREMRHRDGEASSLGLGDPSALEAGKKPR
jgi:hypothetical protein